MSRKHEHSFEMKMEMTPLIDCVFLLIMFFILTTQITVNIEELTLPFSIEGKPKKPSEVDENVMLILNVPAADMEKLKNTADRKGKIMYKGKELTPQELHKELKKEVDYDKAPQPLGRGRPPEIGPNNVELSQLEVLIRYDRNVQAEHLREIFQECQKVGIYKLKIATMPPQSSAGKGG